jgi:hypothetical protein
MHAKISLFIFLLFSLNLSAQDLNLSSKQFGDTLVQSTTMNIEAFSADYKPGEPAHLHISNLSGGYRKLKLGNNPNTLYNPKVNVIAGGNTELKIILRDTSNSIDWSRIRFRPASLGSLFLKPYVDAVGGVGSEWTTLSIPLSDFDKAIDFTQLALIEFPYSADAPNFEMDVAKIEFTGGTTPYLWYGDTKTNNIHDGFGGPGQLVAVSKEAIEDHNTLQYIELYQNDSLIGSCTQSPFEFSVDLQSLGLHTFYAQAHFEDNCTKASPNYYTFVEAFNPLNISVNLRTPIPTDTVILNTDLELDAEAIGTQANESAHLFVDNSKTGYLKLKMGYDPNNIYAPGQNVITGGNDKLEITLRNESGFTNWSKLRLRPKSIGSLNIQKYIEAAGGIGTDWKSIKIPLSDFDPSIDFSNLNYMEFPYSADAGSFQLSIKDIVFTGGSQDFRWFGEDKTDNSNDGLGGSGQLIATLIPAQYNENNIQDIEFYVNDSLIAKDAFPPFTINYIPKKEGNYSAYVKLNTLNQQIVQSGSVHFTAIAPENPISNLDIKFLNHSSGDSALINQDIVFTPSINGEDLESAIYLKTWNTEVGYRKLKLGYDEQNIYGQFQNVVDGGNDTLVLVLKSFSNSIPWDKIRIRPSSIGSLNLGAYVSGDSGDWMTLKIPLSDFDSQIDFSQLSYIEVPYSANAGAFTIGIKEIKFTGGNSPFEWFGPNHFHNAQDGMGGSGQIFAQLQLPSLNPLTADSVYFLVDGINREFATNKPFSFLYKSTAEATHGFQFKLVDSYGYTKFSEPLSLKFYDFNQENYSVLHLNFDQDPGAIEVAIAALKYNKDFAYSFTLDDGKIDGYTFAYPLLHGGTIPETGESFAGLFSTDGCGQDIPFKASIAWNSVSSSFYDIHINTPDYITWSELQEMLASGWEVLNHSYSHAAYGDTDYDFQISANQEAVFNHTGKTMTQFVIPSGDLNYTEQALNYGFQAIYSNKIEFLGYNNGIDLDSPFSSESLKIYRRYMNDDLLTTDNIMDKINSLAEQSKNGNHLWWLDFTHRVRPTKTGGSLVWDTFKYYMQQIENTYGKNGSDRIWFATPTEVLNYVRTRENTQVNAVKNGNTIDVYLNTQQLPSDLNNFFLSLNVNANAKLVSVNSEFSANISYANSSSTQKLVNIEWSKPTQKRMKIKAVYAGIDQTNNSGIEIYPNPLHGDKLHLDISNPEKGVFEIELLNYAGQTILSKTQASNSVKTNIILDITNLKAGIYFLKIKQDSQFIKLQKIVLQ